VLNTIKKQCVLHIYMFWLFLII